MYLLNKYIQHYLNVMLNIVYNMIYIVNGHPISLIIFNIEISNITKTSG